MRAVVDDLAAGVPREVVAARFHHGVAALIEEGCLLLRERRFTVLVHSRVPCNDGGISLGQAGARDRATDRPVLTGLD